MNDENPKEELKESEQVEDSGNSAESAGDKKKKGAFGNLPKFKRVLIPLFIVTAIIMLAAILVCALVPNTTVKIISGAVICLCALVFIL